MFIATILIITRKQKLSKYLSIGEIINYGVVI